MSCDSGTFTEPVERYERAGGQQPAGVPRVLPLPHLRHRNEVDIADRVTFTARQRPEKQRAAEELGL